MRYAKDSGSSEAEFENAMEHARRLMDQFNIDEHQAILDEARTKSVFDSIIEIDAYSRAGGVDQFDRILAAIACQLCDTKMYRRVGVKDAKGNYYRDRKNNIQERETLVFYGLPSDLEMASAVYQELLATMRALIRLRYPDDWKKHFTSYCRGFTSRLWDRAAKASCEPRAEAVTTAIVVRKAELLERFAKEKLTLQTRKARSVKIKSKTGYLSGMTDGDRVDLQQKPAQIRPKLA